MRSKLVLIGLAVFALLAVACGVDTTKDGPIGPVDVPVVQTTEPPAPSAEPTTAAPLLVPDGLVGMNAQLARERLEQIGFTGIIYASVDPNDTVVIYAPNWHVVKVEPAPGTALAADSTIILSCSKQ